MLDLVKAFRIEAELKPPLAVSDSKVVFNAPSGSLIDVESNQVAGEMASPSGDWLEVQESGTMNLNIRDIFRLTDGSSLLATITGRSVPNDVVAPKLNSGAKVLGDEMYFVLSILMETNSSDYAWVNDTIFVGRMTEMVNPADASGMIAYDVYRVAYSV